ncbi:MAG: hypothetical protein KAR64_05050 [Thermoplasmatales archaeon]|nr:hypothetical protein [Thermoplasmatales archaeon]
MNPRKIKALYHFLEFVESIKNMASREVGSLFKDRLFKQAERELRNYHPILERNENLSRRKQLDGIEKYDFEVIMNNIRNIVAHKEISEETNLHSIEWLIKILLKSPSLFSSVKEVDTFLSNITGLKHTTKSTGRDRIVDWYFKEMNEELPDFERDRILEKIIKYIFVTYSTDHKGWTKLLLKIKG